MQQDDFDGLWSEPTHWTSGGFYRCADDPRLMVLKREGVGYTINIAHKRSWLLLGVLVAICLAPIILNVALGRNAPSWLLLVSLLLPITVVGVALVWLSRRDSS